jgi:two-component system sensor histidine kinase DctS
VATYSLQEMLADMVAKPLARSQDVSFTEADGTRLALHGGPARQPHVHRAAAAGPAGQHAGAAP